MLRQHPHLGSALVTRHLHIVAVDAGPTPIPAATSSLRGLPPAVRDPLVHVVQTVLASRHAIADFLLKPASTAPSWSCTALPISEPGRYEPSAVQLFFSRRAPSPEAPIGAVAHAARDALAPIRNVARLLADGSRSAQELRWNLALIETQVGYLGQLIDEMESIAQLRAGRVRLARGLIKLERVVQQALDAVGASTRPTLHRATPGPLTVWADEARLRQALDTLLRLALVESDGGEARVTLSLTRGEAVIDIGVPDATPAGPLAALLSPDTAEVRPRPDVILAAHLLWAQGARIGPGGRAALLRVTLPLSAARPYG
ncbi:HAMP domain-containing histidine kinase [Ectothiorhodospiraceae bacterium 2226]|nr:HAMP domain-containing histidine kinase [Ectothiorhodospiraceae bacterium 2226]